MPTSRKTAFLGKMSPKTKKYLLWGGGVLGGLLVVMRLKHNDKLATMSSTSKTPKPPMLTPAQIAAQMPSTSSQFTPVGYNPWTPPPQYPQPYYQQQYQSPYAQYPQPYYPPQQSFCTLNPGAPGCAGTLNPYTPNNQAACQSVVGMNAVSARQRLLGLGIYAQVVNINGRAIAQTALQTGGPTAQLWVRNGIVQAAQCSATTGQLNPIPAAY